MYEFSINAKRKRNNIHITQNGRGRPKDQGGYLNGSRTNKRIAQDDLQDFDIIYLVKELESFRSDPKWIDVFGERIIMQMPIEMSNNDLETEPRCQEIVYLMLFNDGNRIDLRLIETKNKDECNDSLNKILLDKDNLLEDKEEPNDQDYWINAPSQKAFSNCCNEFWWVSTYVVKGLARDELLYAREMLEIPVRKMFMQMIVWLIGTEKGFKINVGKSNRFLKHHIDDKLWLSILQTFPNAGKVNIWNSLMEMTRVFHEKAFQVADGLCLQYNMLEAENVQAYILSMKHRIVENNTPADEKVE